MTAKVVAVINRKGGSGKTTTAVTLAELAARTGTPATVVDLDPMAGAAMWSDLAAADPMAAKVIQPPSNVSAVQLPRWARAELTGLVFIDVGPGDIAAHEAAAEIAGETGGMIIVPTSADSADVVQTINTLASLVDAPAPVAVLLVKVGTGTVRQREARAELVAYGAEVMTAEVLHRQEIAQESGAGPFKSTGCS